MFVENATDGCDDHTYDAGVKCQAYEDECTATEDSTVQTTEMTTTQETMSTTLSIGDNLNQAAIKSCNHEILGALIGLLAAALVGVTVGWIVSCVYWQRKITQR